MEANKSDSLNTVLSYPKLKEMLENEPADKVKVVKIFNEISGDFSEAWINATIKFIDNVIMKLYDSVNLNVPDHIDLNELVQKNHVIFVPNHQSHADYVAITYSIFKNFKIPVYIASGINLNVWPIGPYFRRSGAFFMRRRFANDLLYKTTFEAYIYSLLIENKPVEFFFEGGRTRTGKLLPPKYGIFGMLLEAHKYIPNAKPLCFLPIAVAHEQIPEEKSHAKELSGRKKTKESTAGLLKIFGIAKMKLGSVHLNITDPVYQKQLVNEDIKSVTQHLAFDCFKKVGKAIPVTPSSLLAMTMLDEPSGALTWNQIKIRAMDVINYCNEFNIPVTSSLEPDCAEQSLKIVLDLFINNKKINVIKKEKLGQIFYTIKESRRVEVLFHKNMILHHFIVPGFINATWFNIFNGNIDSASKLTKFLMVKRKELKYEFYLPSVREMIGQAIDIVAFALGKRVKSLDECLEFSSQELYEIAHKIRRFSTAFSYIYESYYISVTSIKYLANDNFTEDQFLSIAEDLFKIEIEHGRIVKYPESFTVPAMKDTLKYLLNLKILKVNSDNTYSVVDIDRVNTLIEKFARDINDQVSINLKFNKSGDVDLL